MEAPNRNPKPKIRTLDSETRNSNPGIRNPKSKPRIPKPEIRNPGFRNPNRGMLKPAGPRNVIALATAAPAWGLPPEPERSSTVT